MYESRDTTPRTHSEKRKFWTESEDQLLLDAVLAVQPHSTKGTGNWVRVAQRMKQRTAKQCRERWCNQANPAINKSPFNAAEDQTIMTMKKMNGSKWATIAQALPGRTETSFRTDNQVKNRWYSTLKRRQCAANDGVQDPNVAVRRRRKPRRFKKTQSATCQNDKSPKRATLLQTSLPTAQTLHFSTVNERHDTEGVSGQTLPGTHSVAPYLCTTTGMCSSLPLSPHRQRANKRQRSALSPLLHSSNNVKCNAADAASDSACSTSCPQTTSSTLQSGSATVASACTPGTLARALGTPRGTPCGGAPRPLQALYDADTCSPGGLLRDRVESVVGTGTPVSTPELTRSFLSELGDEQLLLVPFSAISDVGAEFDHACNAGAAASHAGMADGVPPSRLAGCSSQSPAKAFAAFFA